MAAPKKKSTPDVLKVEGVAGFEGSFELNQAAITMGDMRIIKRVAGVRAGELDEAARAGDLDVIIALAMIAMKHAGHPHWEAFEDAIEDVPLEVAKIDYIAGESEDDAKDPQPAGDKS